MKIKLKDGQKVDVASVKLYKNGSLKKIKLEYAQKIRTPLGYVGIGHDVLFYKNGKIKEMELAEDFSMRHIKYFKYDIVTFKEN